MKSGLYTFSDGHIYYNKNVIKIRYDLTNSIESFKYTEADIFDWFEDLFDIPLNFKINSNTPFDSFSGHRFCYFISDQGKKKPKQLLIVPYLHEKKVFLSRIKINT